MARLVEQQGLPQPDDYSDVSHSDEYDEDGPADGADQLDHSGYPAHGYAEWDEAVDPDSVRRASSPSVLPSPNRY